MEKEKNISTSFFDQCQPRRRHFCSLNTREKKQKKKKINHYLSTTDKRFFITELINLSREQFIAF